MKIECLSVVNFRNLSTQKIVFSSGLNVLYGRNAQGKTNTLEAIYCATIGRSPRTRKDAEMIAFTQNGLHIDLSYTHNKTVRNIEVELKGGNKNISIDGNKLSRMSDVIGNFGSVYFSPEELHLIQGSPIYRRRFMDIINCQLSKKYLSDLQHFQRLLNQRNALLKNSAKELSGQIGVWNEQLASFGVKLFVLREAFCRNVQQFAGEIHKELTDGAEELTVSYESIADSLPAEELKQLYLKGLEKSFERDRVLGYTTYGVQNDDFEVRVNGVDLRKAGSQGQQRTATLSLKLAELEILREEYGDYPVLLLDDVLSELDFVRRQKLVEKIKDIQCILTCTEFGLDLPCVKFEVSDGAVIKKD